MRHAPLQPRGIVAATDRGAPRGDFCDPRALAPHRLVMGLQAARRPRSGGHEIDVVHGEVQTDRGVVRDRNEDAAYVDPEGRFFLLADGMGGRNGGDVASRTAIDVVRMLLDGNRAALTAFDAAPSARGRQRLRRWIDRAVRDANDVVLARGGRDPRVRGMGTTLEVVVVAGGEVFIAHVGDSRTYLVRGGAARSLTKDHTVAHALLSAGMIHDDAAASSEARSVLTNAVGCSAAIEVDHVHLQLHPGDRLLMCSDGLYDYFSAPELATHVAGEPDPAAALARLVAGARDRGGHDNITGIVITGGASAAPLGEIEDPPTEPIAMPRLDRP